MNIAQLSTYFDRLEKISSRLEITRVLAELYKKISEEEAEKTTYMMLGRLAPSYKNIVFNVAEQMVIRAVAKAFGRKEEKIKEQYKKLGDLGLVVASQSQKGSKNGSLSVSEIYTKLVTIARESGEGSVEKKVTGIADLVKSIDPLSAKFIVRIILGKLRLGFSDKTVLDALSWMETGDKSKAKLLDSAYQVVPDVGKLAREAKEKGIDRASRNISPEVGIPVMPMLAARLKSPADMIKKMSEVAVEPKFDGLRVQIHYQEGKPVRAFTRNLNDVSEMFPELTQIGKHLNAKSAILDSEAVGLDSETMKLANFQTTMNRRRKHNIEESAKKTPLTFQIFDLIFKDGESFMKVSYKKRREVLQKLVNENKVFFIDEYLATNDPDIITQKHKEFLDKGLEGVIVKKLDSDYVPGRTGWRWVKMKEIEAASGKLADTVDAVIMGYTRGLGKRASFGVGQFLAGVKSGDRFLSITKVGTGLTDEQFKELKKRLYKIKVKDKPKKYEVHKDLFPDFWVSSEVVVELAADELTKSPKHTAGLALRFPRLVNFRDDKSAKQATTLGEIKKLHRLQER